MAKRPMSDTASAATAIPARPLSKPSSELSIDNWRKSCQRVAPTARRMAISRRRPAVREVSNNATLAQPTRSTVDAAAHKSQSGRRKSPATKWENESRSMK